MDGLRALAGLTDDELAYLEVVDAIAEQQVEPAAAEVDNRCAVPVPIRDALLESGVAVLGVAESKGGGGAGPVTTVCALQSLARSSGSVGMAVVALHAACVGWTGSWAAEPLAVTGERWPTMADAGRAPEGLVTKMGDGTAVLDGTLDEVSCAAPQGPVVVIVGTADGLVVVVDPAEPGKALVPGPRRSGLRGTPVVSLVLRAVRTPWAADASPLGPARTIGALGTGAVALGLAERAVDETVAHVHHRRQFGRRLIEFEMVRAMVDGMARQVTESAAALYAVARATGVMSDDGGSVNASALAASRAAVGVCLDAVQLHGGGGYMGGAPVERLLRDAFSVRARAHRHVALGP